MRHNYGTILLYCCVSFLVVPLCNSETNGNPKWSQNGITVANGNVTGSRYEQYTKPCDIYVDDNQTLYTIDYHGYLVVEWKNNATIGKVIFDGSNHERPINPLYVRVLDVIIDKENDDLILCVAGDMLTRWPNRDSKKEIIISNFPCDKLAMDNDNYIYASDSERHEVRRWRIGNTYRKLVAGGNGVGRRLDQLYYPLYICVDQDQSVYISDIYNHRIMKWLKDATEGIIIAGGQTDGNSLMHLSYPSGVTIDKFGNVYVVDQNNQRVMYWSNNGTQVCIVVGGNGIGDHQDQLHDPRDLSLDQQGNLYVTDTLNNRVQRFNINSKTIEN